MPITKRTPKIAAISPEAEAFISAAPDAAAPAAAPAPEAPKRVKKGRKVQITLTISEDLLARVDARADLLGQSRAAMINLAIAQSLESGFRLDGAGQ